jgi:hypothetical protein
VVLVVFRAEVVSAMVSAVFVGLLKVHPTLCAFTVSADF